jgi:dCTP deaminase
MMLSDRELRKYLDAGRIRIDPTISQRDIRPTGIRLHLGDVIFIPRAGVDPISLDGSTEPEFEKAAIPPEGYVLHPGDLILGGSREVISTDADLVCQLDGRSTLARLGLMVHLGSTIFDHVQFQGRAVTFEILNAGPFTIKLHRGDAIALLTVFELSSPIEQQEHEQYSGQRGPLPPRLRVGPRRKT